MHWLNMVTLLAAATLVGVEFSVSAFINPAALRLGPEPRKQILSRTAFVFGRVMPVWYPVCAILFGLETWLQWHTPCIGALLAADAIWLLVLIGTIVFLVPLNTKVAQQAPGWQQIHRTWDTRHRVRIAALAIATALLGYMLVR